MFNTNLLNFKCVLIKVGLIIGNDRALVSSLMMIRSTEKIAIATRTLIISALLTQE